MVKVQISLPFSSSIKLSVEQKAKLLRCQGRRLRVDDTELGNIVAICRDNGWLNNGLAFVYEYAGSIDNIVDCMNKLCVAVTELEEKIYTNDLVLINMTLINYGLVLLRLVSVLYQWRNLQSIPRPIYVQSGGSVITMSSFLQDLGERYLKIIKSTPSDDYSPWHIVPNELLVGILATSKEFDSVLEMSPFFYHYDQSDEASQSRLYSYFFLMKELLDTEVRIADDWRTVKVEHSKLPTLRFPFLGITSSESSPIFIWFSSRQHHFPEISQFLGSLSNFLEKDVLHNERYTLIRHVLPMGLLNPSINDIIFWEVNMSKPPLLFLGCVSPVIFQFMECRSPFNRSFTSPQPLIVPETDFILDHKQASAQQNAIVQYDNAPVIEANFETRVIRSSSAVYDRDMTDGKSPERGRFYSADFLQSAHHKAPFQKRNMASAVQIILSPSFSPLNKHNYCSGMLDVQTLLTAAFANVENRNWSSSWVAAGKIAVWYRLMAPRQKLLRRMYGRRCVQQVLLDIIDNAVRISRLRHKRKFELLRQGAAVKIQRALKHWFYVTLEERKGLEEQFRKQQTIKFLSKWKYCVLTAIRLWKILRRIHEKRQLDKRVSFPRQPQISKVLEAYVVLYCLKEKSERDKDLMSRPSEKFQKFRAIERAIVAIQKLIKHYVQRKRIEKAKFLNDMGTRITLFLIKCLAVRKVRQKRRIFESATKIQKFLRGVRIRRQVYRIVSSGLRLNACCRKYIAYKGLKSQLRRVDRPLTIQLHGLRNIAERLVNTGNIRIKISVWWNPLLHIVGHHDFHAILQSKRPQFVFESTTYKTSLEDELEKPKSEDLLTQLQRSAPGNKISNSPIKDSKAFVARNTPAPRQQRTSIMSGSQTPILPAITNSTSSSRGRSAGVLASIHEKQQRTNSLSSYNSHDIEDVDKGDDENDDEERESGEGTDSHKGSSIEPLVNRSSFTDQLKTLAAKKVLNSNEGGNEKSDGPSPNKFSVVRGTLNFAMRLGHAVQRQQSPNTSPVPQQVIKYFCNFEDLSIKIPGCHGNSVIKFELLDGDRKIGNCLFYLGRESGMMYWGGDYQREVEVTHQKRAVQFNSNILAQSNDRSTKYLQNPVLAFRLVAGAPLRSRCQWGRLIVRGSGPLKRALQSQDIISHLTIFDNWRRFYLSLDEFGLFFFENKFSCKSFAFIPVCDFKSVAVDNVVPLRAQGATSKNIVEDITSVVLTTKHGDEVFIRFPDAASRIAWFEVFGNVVSHNKKSSNSIKQKGWFSKSFGEIASTLRKMNLSPLKVRNNEADEADEEAEDDEEPVMLPSQIVRSRKTIFGSTHNIF